MLLGCFFFFFLEKTLLLYELRAFFFEAAIFSLFYFIKVYVGLYCFTFSRCRVKDKSDRATVEQVSP